MPAIHLNRLEKSKFDNSSLELWEQIRVENMNLEVVGIQMGFKPT
jgi:hypothetical protein